MSFLSGDAPQINFKPISATGGGLSASYSGGGIGGSGGGYSVTPDANRTAAVGGVANTYSDLASKTAGLGAMVTPGYNNLLTTQLTGIDNAARSAVGNLQQNLQSRRVLGSSFGQDTLTRANAEFQKQRNDVTAQNYLQSLDSSNKLLQQEYQARTQAANTGLSELNLEAGVANGLIGSTNSIMGQNAQAQAKLDAQAQQGQGQFLGKLISIGAAPFTGGASLAMMPAFSGSSSNPGVAGSLY